MIIGEQVGPAPLDQWSTGRDGHTTQWGQDRNTGLSTGTSSCDQLAESEPGSG